MKKLNITKEQFNRSSYFQRKYGKLEYVSESGKMFKTNKGKVLKFKESWNKDDYDDQPRKFRPKFDIGEKVSLTRSFYREFYDYYNDDPKKFKLDVDSIDDLPSDGWMIEDVKTEEGIEGATGLHRPYYSYYITNLDMDSGYEDDSIKGIWVYQDWIKSEEGSVKESTRRARRSARRFNEARGPEWLNSFKQAQDLVDKACEQLEVVAFEGGADVGNPIHKKLLRIWSEMRDVIESA